MYCSYVLLPRVHLFRRAIYDTTAGSTVGIDPFDRNCIVCALRSFLMQKALQEHACHCNARCYLEHCILFSKEMAVTASPLIML